MPGLEALVGLLLDDGDGLNEVESPEVMEPTKVEVHYGGAGPSPTRFPCLNSLNTYTGCVGFACCPAVRCWSGHIVSVSGERLLQEVTVDHYTPSQCHTCARIIEVPGERKQRGRLKDGRLVTCAAGLWDGLASVYNLHNHRLPLKPEAAPPCPGYSPLPQELLRPELMVQREAARQLAKNRRQRLKRERAA